VLGDQPFDVAAIRFHRGAMIHRPARHWEQVQNANSSPCKVSRCSDAPE
jgi:hypothetical protein